MTLVKTSDAGKKSARMNGNDAHTHSTSVGLPFLTLRHYGLISYHAMFHNYSSTFKPFPLQQFGPVIRNEKSILRNKKVAPLPIQYFLKFAMSAHWVEIKTKSARQI